MIFSRIRAWGGEDRDKNRDKILDDTSESRQVTMSVSPFTEERVGSMGMYSATIINLIKYKTMASANIPC